MEKLSVVAAVVERGGLFLVGRRSAHKASAPRYWCPVTGRVEAGETEAQAVVREVLEETGLRVEAVEKLCEVDTRDGTARIRWWVARPLDDAPARLMNDEHTELRWVTVDEMRALDPVFPEDVAIFARYRTIRRSGRKPRP